MVEHTLCGTHILLHKIPSLWYDIFDKSIYICKPYTQFPNYQCIANDPHTHTTVVQRSLVEMRFSSPLSLKNKPIKKKMKFLNNFLNHFFNNFFNIDVNGRKCYAIGFIGQDSLFVSSVCFFTNFLFR